MKDAEELVSLVAFCEGHGVDTSLILTFHEGGLIEIIRQGDTLFLQVESVPKLEKIVRLNIDLNINLEGVDAISHLLERVESLQQENIALRNRISRYE